MFEKHCGDIWFEINHVVSLNILALQNLMKKFIPISELRNNCIQLFILSPCGVLFTEVWLPDVM